VDQVIALQKGGGLMSGNSEVFADLWAAVVSLLVRVSVNIDNNVVSRLRDQIFATGLSAALISLALCLFILVHYCRSYRRQVLVSGVSCVCRVCVVCVMCVSCVSCVSCVVDFLFANARSCE
jgi:uncharacterized membrane protein